MWNKTIWLSAFFLLLLLPTAGLMTGAGVTSDEDMIAQEARRKTAFTPTRPSMLAQWYEDNLGFRAPLLALHRGIMYGGFGQSPREGRVRIGRDGWLFLSDDLNKTFTLHSGGGSHPPRLLATLGQDYARFIAALKDRGIPVLLVVAPDKATIYGEYYPAWVKRTGASFPRSALLNGAPGGEHILFLEDALMRFRRHSPLPLYYRTDTHWNALGALVGYDAVMDAAQRLLGRPLQRVRLRHARVIHEPAPRHDLASFLGVALPDMAARLTTSPALDATLAERWNPRNANTWRWENPSALNTLDCFLVHDSFFAGSPAPWLQTFSSIEGHHVWFNPEDAIFRALTRRAAKPDLVIVMMVERDVVALAPKFASLGQRLAQDLRIPAAPGTREARP